MTESPGTIEACEEQSNHWVGILHGVRHQLIEARQAYALPWARWSRHRANAVKLIEDAAMWLRAELRELEELRREADRGEGEQAKEETTAESATREPSAEAGQSQHAG